VALTELISPGVLGLAIVLLFLALMLVFAALGRMRPGVNLRSLSAYQRLTQAIGIAVESGRCIHVSLGSGEFNGLQAGSALVGLGVLERVARTASISDKPSIATSGDGTLGILSQETISTAFASIGASNQFDANLGQVAGITPLSYAAGTVQVVSSEQVSATVIAGHIGSEVALIADAAAQTGGVTLGGSNSLPAQAVLAATAQEPLLGEELYAAGAYLNTNVVNAASLRAQDFLRWVLIAAMLVGAVLKFLGVV
jgi:hypothetical protein